MDEEWYKKLEMKLKASDEFHHQKPDALAWSKMEARLDETFKKKKQRRFLWLIMLLPLLITGTWFFTRPQEKNNVARKYSDAQLVKPSLSASNKDLHEHTLAKKEEALPLTNSETTPVQHNRLATNTINNSKANKNDTGNNLKTKEATPGLLQYVVTVDHKKLSTATKLFQLNKTGSTQQKGRDRKTKNKKDNQPQTDAIAAVNTRIITVKSQQEKLVVNKKEEAPLQKNNPVLFTNMDSSQQIKPKQIKPKQIVATDSVAIVSGHDTTKAKTHRDQSTTGFFVGVGASYSFSSVHTGDVKTGNQTLDLKLGYQLGRFTMAAGLSAGKVLYNASPYDYKPTKPYNMYGYTIKAINANCYILDIPLSLSYTFYQKNKYQAFVSAGVSSQILKRETYNYTASRNDSLREGSWQYQNENQHLFSAAQLSVGIIYKINNSVFIEAEPFYRMPLKGIGHGFIRLRSAGIGVGIRYFPFYRSHKI